MDLSVMLEVNLFNLILALDVKGYWQKPGAFYEYQTITCSATLPLYTQLPVQLKLARKLKLEAVITVKSDYAQHVLPFPQEGN